MSIGSTVARSRSTSGWCQTGRTSPIKRAHLDVKLVRSGQNWFVLADPEGKEFCLFAMLALAGATNVVRRIDHSWLTGMRSPKVKSSATTPDRLVLHAATGGR